jgi:hypothetical protein
MRLIIICLCLCSGVSLVAFSRVGFPEDPLHILVSPRPAADREAKDQARFARLLRPPVMETIGAPVVQNEVIHTPPVEEPVRAEAPAAQMPVADLPRTAPAPAASSPAGKAEPASERHPAVLRARLLVTTAHMAMQRRVLFVRAAMTPYRPKTPSPRRIQWASGTPASIPSEPQGRPARKSIASEPGGHFVRNE